MPTLNEYFDKVFCINLRRRVDRWQHALAQCEKHKLTLERFEAYDGCISDGKVCGVLGCTSSHRALLDIISYCGWKRTLILEDDFEFRFDDSQKRFSDMIPDVPNDWDMLYIGGHYGEKPQRRISPTVIQIGRMLATHAYGVTREFARATAPYLTGGAIDSIYGKFHLIKKCYCLQPRLVTQMPNYSDIAKRETNNVWATTDSHHEEMV